MAKSKIIKDLVNGESTIASTLYRLLVIANDISDKRLAAWIESELNGYDDSTELPLYRIIEGIDIRYSGLNGRFQVKNQPLPLSCIPDDIYNEIKKFQVSLGILAIEDLISNKQTLGIDLLSLAGEIYRVTGSIQCLSVFGNCDMTKVANIPNKVKTITLNILMELERKFGMLDDLDIEVTHYSKKEIEDIRTSINVIIYDNSVSLGNNNRIQKSKFLSGVNFNGNKDRK